MYKKIALLVLFAGATAALAAPPAGTPPEPITRPPVPNDAALPAPHGVPLPPLGASELPTPRPLPAGPAAPPPVPTTPQFKMAPVTPSPDVEALRSELNHLHQENDRMLLGRRSVLPSEAERPKGGADPETSLELRLRLANKLAVLRKMREEARAKAPPEPPPPVPGSTPPPKGKPATEKGPPTVEPTPEHGDTKESPVDAPGLGRVLFLSGDHAKALATYTAIDPAEQRPEDHLLTRYMMACCYRKMGKLDEAEALYREVGNSGGSESLVTNAQWHLQTMKGHRELAADLARLRTLRETLTRREE